MLNEELSWTEVGGLWEANTLRLSANEFKKKAKCVRDAESLLTRLLCNQCNPREGKKNADSSCWLRVAQVWAGRGWGAFFWPRIGHEVVVVFEEGDPDQPLIVGSVYNAENMPPYELPKKRSSQV